VFGLRCGICVGRAFVFFYIMSFVIAVAPWVWGVLVCVAEVIADGCGWGVGLGCWWGVGG